MDTNERGWGRRSRWEGFWTQLRPSSGIFKAPGTATAKIYEGCNAASIAEARQRTGCSG